MLAIKRTRTLVNWRSFSVFKALSDQTRELKDVVNKESTGELFVGQDVSLDRGQYQKYLEECKYGDLQTIEFTDKNVSLYLASTAANSVNVKNVYKVLNKLKPDMVLLQGRPAMSNYKGKEFIPADYLQELIKEPEEILPSNELYYEIKNELTKNGILIGGQPLLSKRTQEIRCDRLSDQIIGFSSVWCKRNHARIALSDMPERIYIQSLANSFSLKEFQNIFHMSSIKYGYHQSDYEMPLYEAAIHCFPDVFLFFSDKYMAATLLQFLEAARDKKWLLFCGYGQGKSLEHYIKRQDYKYTIEKCWKVPERFSTIIRKESVDMLIEKLAIIETIRSRKITEEITLTTVDDCCKISLEWIKDEVEKELGASHVQTRIKLFVALINKYVKEKAKGARIGKEKRITELKSQMLNASPKI